MTPNHVPSFSSVDPSSGQVVNGAAPNGADGGASGGLHPVEEEEDCCDVGVIPPPPMFSSSPPREEDELPPGMLNYMYDKRGQPQMVDHNGADGQDHHHDDDETDENLAQLELELSSGKRENLLLLMPGIYYQK